MSSALDVPVAHDVTGIVDKQQSKVSERTSILTKANVFTLLLIKLVSFRMQSI